MRPIANGRGMLIALALLVTVSTAACTANQTKGTTPAATATATVGPAATVAATPSAAEPSVSPPAAGGVQNLVISSAGRSELTAAYAATYAAGRKIPVSDLGAPAAIPGSVYYAYDLATRIYWAMADFKPTRPFSDSTAYMDGTSRGLFKKVGTGSWQVIIPINPDICGELRFFPSTVLTAWSLPTTTPAGLTC